jgi:hypothetical protein
MLPPCNLHPTARERASYIRFPKFSSDPSDILHRNFKHFLRVLCVRHSLESADHDGAQARFLFFDPNLRTDPSDILHRTFTPLPPRPSREAHLATTI